MQEGIIIVEGDCGEAIGFRMEGGEIHIEGEFTNGGAYSQVTKGKIFHQGKLIIDR